MPTTKTHPACTECDYLKGWIKNGHICKNLAKNGDIAGNAEDEENNSSLH